MALSAALVSKIDYYHPPKTTHTPIDTLIWAIVLLAILGVTVAAAHLARSRETRKLAESQDNSGS